MNTTTPEATRRLDVLCTAFMAALHPLGVSIRREEEQLTNMHGKSVQVCREMGYSFPSWVGDSLVVHKTGRDTYELRDPKDEQRDN